MARSSWDNSEGHVEWESEGQRGTEGKGAGPETWVAIVLTCAEDGRGAGEMARSILMCGARRHGITDSRTLVGGDAVTAGHWRVA
jgi:hypothetical protein